MTLITRTLSIAFMALLLQACELDDGLDSSSDKNEKVTYTKDDSVATIRPPNTNKSYEFLLKADDTILTLKDNLSEITVQGNENNLTIDSDTRISSISITGNNNIVNVEDGVKLTVDNLNIQGSGNNVTVYKIKVYTSSNDTEGVANLACEVNSNGVTSCRDKSYP